jgi:hypothetical protein
MKWTKEEDLILRHNAPFMTAPELAERLGRGVSSVKYRLNLLGIKLLDHREFMIKNRDSDWSLDELRLLKIEAGRTKTKTLAKRLGKSTRALRSKASRENVSLKRVSWSDTQIEALERMVSENKSWVEIGEEIGKSPNACRNKANYLMIEKPSPQVWSQEDKERLLELKRQGVKWSEISKTLNKKVGAVQRMYWRLISH